MRAHKIIQINNLDTEGPITVTDIAVFMRSLRPFQYITHQPMLGPRCTIKGGKCVDAIKVVAFSIQSLCVQTAFFSQFVLGG